MNFANRPEDDGAAQRLAVHLMFGSWSFFGFWILVFGVYPASAHPLLIAPPDAAAFHFLLVCGSRLVSVAGTSR